jgi:hypothetical protein
MIEDLNVYKIQKSHAQRWFLNKGNGDIDKAISALAIITSCPCIVVAYWIGEVAGWPPEVKEAIDRFKKFYHYEKILNIPDSCPYK